MNCPINKDCGGCNYLNIDYKDEINIKINNFNRLLHKNNLNYKINNNDFIKSDNYYNYRYKVIGSVCNIDNKLRLGLYKENSKIVLPFLDCLIQDLDCNYILKEIEFILNKYKIKAYDNFNKRGIIKHVLIRKSTLNEFLIVLVTSSYLLPNNKLIVKDILNINKNIKTIVQNINEKNTSLVLSDKEKILYGKGFIKERIDDLIFNLSSNSFYQINPLMMNKLYNEAINLANITKNDIVMDTYSGIGTISLKLSKYSKEVIAVEINKNAYIDSLNNKKNNNINNVKFFNDDVSKFMRTFKSKIDILFLDPPREGSDYNFLNSLMILKPKKVVYISCGPESLVRDLKILEKIYKIDKIKLVDMFPRTKHVETVCLLSRMKINEQ